MGESARVRLALGFVHPEVVDGRFLHSFIRTRDKYAAVYAFGSGPRIDIGRNLVVSQFLAEDCTHLLMVDADMVFGPSHVERIVKHDHDIVSGLYFAGSPYDPVPLIIRKGDLKRPTDWPRNELIDVDGAGCGFLLIKRHVLEKMGEKWFRQDEQGEDIYFCRMAKRMGYSIELDTGITLGHMKPYPMTIEDFDGVPANKQDRRHGEHPE